MSTGGLDPTSVNNLQYQYQQTRQQFGSYSIDPRFNGGFDENKIRSALSFVGFGSGPQFGADGTIGGAPISALGLPDTSANVGDIVDRFDTGFGGAGNSIMNIAESLDPGGMASQLNTKYLQAKQTEAAQKQADAMQKYQAQLAAYQNNQLAAYRAQQAPQQGAVGAPQGVGGGAAAGAPAQNSNMLMVLVLLLVLRSQQDDKKEVVLSTSDVNYALKQLPSTTQPPDGASDADKAQFVKDHEANVNTLMTNLGLTPASYDGLDLKIAAIRSKETALNASLNSLVPDVANAGTFASNADNTVQQKYDKIHDVEALFNTWLTDYSNAHPDDTVNLTGMSFAAKYTKLLAVLPQITDHTSQEFHTFLNTTFP